MKEFFTNKKLAKRVFEKTALKAEWYSKYRGEVPANDVITYDSRDMLPLSYLVDMTNVPEADREQYYKTELEKMTSAFDTLDPNTGRPYPEAIRPYLKRMYDKFLSTASNDVDWNDERQLTDFVNSMLLCQTINSMFDSYTDIVLDMFPSAEERMRLDALVTKSSATYMRANESLKKSGININRYNILTLGSDSTFRMQFTDYVRSVSGEAALKDDKTINVDPSFHELLADYFLERPVRIREYSSNVKSYFTFDTDDLNTGILEAFLESNGAAMVDRSLTKQYVLNGEDKDMSDFLLINGVPLSDIVKSEGVSGRTAYLRSAEILRNALTDGKSVVETVRMAYDKDNKVHFNHQEIKVDLDKLNEVERKANNNFFKRLFHRWGLIKIKNKFPTNEERRANQSDPAAKRDIDLKRATYEKRIVDDFNSIRKDNPHSSFSKKSITDFKLTEKTLNVLSSAENEAMSKRGVETELDGDEATSFSDREPISIKEIDPKEEITTSKINDGSVKTYSKNKGSLEI